MDVTLRNIEEFKAVLEAYQPSDVAIETLKRTPLTIMLGISGAGRNTIINHLVNSGNYHFIISDTTRPPKFRDGRMEQNGVNYYFRSEDDMLQDLKKGLFLEAELIHNQQVSGISIRELKKSAASGKIPVNEVDIGGTEAIRRAKPDTHFFFVIPPSYKEWLYRLHGREIMTEQEVKNRLQTAKRILKSAIDHPGFFFIVNDSSHASAERIDDIVRHSKRFNDNEARKSAIAILDELSTSTH